MNTQPSQVDATEPIRTAIASGEFQRATRLWDVYAAGLQEELRNGSCTARRLEEARALVEWSRITVQCARARAQDQLDSLHAAGRYDPGVPGDPDPAVFRIHF